MTDNPRTDTNVMASMAVTAQFTADLTYVITILQVLSGMEPEAEFFVGDGPVSMRLALRLLQCVAAMRE